MNFSNKFKQIYWWILLSVLSGLCIWRLFAGEFLNFDIFLFIFWFIILLFPIISEISLFGLNVKKDINSVKEELKSQLADIKSSLVSNQHQTINIHTSPADKKEIEQKQKDDLYEEEDPVKPFKSRKDFSLTPNTDLKRVGSSEKAQERHARGLLIENLVNQYLHQKYSFNYKPQIKIADADSDKKIVTDGIVFTDDNKIDEIIEIKTTSIKGVESFYFPLARFIQKLQKLGLKNRVRFMVVSEVMDIDMVRNLKKQFNQLRFAKALGAKMPSISVNYFKLDNEALEEIVDPTE